MSEIRSILTYKTREHKPGEGENAVRTIPDLSSVSFSPRGIVILFPFQ